MTEDLVDHEFVTERCDAEDFATWASFISSPEYSPEATEEITGVPAAELRAAARLYATGGNAAIYYGLGVTEHSQGSTMVMGMANLAMATGNIGREGVGVNPLRGQNNVQGSCDMGSFPHELPGYRHVLTTPSAISSRSSGGASSTPSPGFDPEHVRRGCRGNIQRPLCPRRGHRPVGPNTHHVRPLSRRSSLHRPGPLLERDGKFAHVFFPGTSFLEKDGTFTNAERRINRVRPVMAPRTGKQEWQVVCDLATALGYPMATRVPARSWTRSRR